MKTTTIRRLPRRSLLATCLCTALTLGAGNLDAAALPQQAASAGLRPAQHMQAGLDLRAPRVPNPLAEQWKLLHPPAPPRPQGGITHVVTNCNNDGAGSLRNAVGAAASGDTIDMSALACSSISLTTGALVTGVDDLALIGPGMNSLTIGGGNDSPVLVHVGAGQLSIDGFTVTAGAKYAAGANDAPGGCIYSQGNVFMNDAGAKYCLAQANGTGQARGGAVYAKLGAVVLNSVISGSEAHSANSSSTGGGLHTPGDVFAKYSIFRNNVASAGGSGDGYGGAAFVAGDVFIGFSTVHGNTADHIGGLELLGTAASANLQISNSTITDNYASASELGSGVFIGNNATISNSTISGNTEANASNIKYGAGLFVKYGIDVELNSTIISGNSLFDGTFNLPSDMGTPDNSDSVVSGSHNLIGTNINFASIPPDTVITADPMLGSLGSHGGPTPTMLPLGGSLAINAGSGGGDYDQRGPGFPRSVGAGVDIGAVESDTIFVDGFD